MRIPVLAVINIDTVSTLRRMVIRDVLLSNRELELPKSALFVTLYNAEVGAIENCALIMLIIIDKCSAYELNSNNHNNHNNK
jgi:hypothetical protein